MEITGTQLIAAPRLAVWQALNDPAVLKPCLPGCESVERAGADELLVVIAAAIGPLRARFKGRLQITEAQPPQSCVMVFEGQGGAVGFGKGRASVTLRETPEGTELAHAVKAEVGGKLAQVGSRLVDSVARKMSDDFFNALRAQLAPPAPAADPAPSAAAAPVAAPADASVAVPAAAAPAPTAPSARAAATPPAPQPAGPVMVPGWWLLVAAAVGSLATLAGPLLGR